MLPYVTLDIWGHNLEDLMAFLYWIWLRSSAFGCHLRNSVLQTAFIARRHCTDLFLTLVHGSSLMPSFVCVSDSLTRQYRQWIKPMCPIKASETRNGLPERDSIPQSCVSYFVTLPQQEPNQVRDLSSQNGIICHFIMLSFLKLRSNHIWSYRARCSYFWEHISLELPTTHDKFRVHE